jgi:hypothetical protein
MPGGGFLQVVSASVHDQAVKNGERLSTNWPHAEESEDILELII